jgi:hypothetical protein
MVSGLDVRNNIFRTNRNIYASANDREWAIYSDAPANAFNAINYNVYREDAATGILGFLNGDRTTLSDWQAATGQDANSLALEPIFVSTSNLHLLTGSNCALHRMGTPIAGITTDIDGNTRNAVAPDMGADEFIAPVIGNVTWSGISNTNWFDVRNWGCKELPNATSDVVIPSPVPNYPVLNANTIIKSLKVNTGASINLLTGIILTLKGL